MGDNSVLVQDEKVNRKVREEPQAVAAAKPRKGDTD